MNISEKIYVAESLDPMDELQVGHASYLDSFYLDRAQAIQLINHMMKLFVIDNRELIGGIDESGHTGN